MKLAAALFTSFLTGALSREISMSSTIRADSKIGMEILSNSRRVEDANEQQDTSWIGGFAIKFQGCHHVSQWNSEADGDESVRIETRRLARFRLCPVSSCSDNSGTGCRSGYGDYIVDMDTFLPSYVENKQEEQESACQSYAYQCDCEENDQYNDYYTEEDCYNKCYKNAGMSECVEEEEDENAYYESVSIADYTTCQAYGGRRRKLEDAGDGQYYIGPYCSDQGGKIVLGLFTDDSCTEFADDYGGRATYLGMTGQDLPYGQDSIVDTKCYTCEAEEEKNYSYKQNGYYYDENGDVVEQEEEEELYQKNGYYYNQDGERVDPEETEVKEVCTTLYEGSGKCEDNLSPFSGFSSNSNACNYIEGIRITRSDGLIIRGNVTSNKVASAFISVFGLCFVGLASYVYYLKTKLDRGTINLN